MERMEDRVYVQETVETILTANHFRRYRRFLSAWSSQTLRITPLGLHNKTREVRVLH